MSSTKKLYIGFDFSINKPAATFVYEGNFYFYAWPTKLPKKKVLAYNTSGVSLYSRELDSVKKHTGEDCTNSDIIFEHTRRAAALINKIIKDIDYFIGMYIKEPVEVYVATEGLSFNSVGNSTLDLAMYKGVLQSKLYEHFGEQLKGLYTYPPQTIKKIAGASKKPSKKKNKPVDDDDEPNKSKQDNKIEIIKSFMKAPDLKDNTFYKDFMNNKFISKAGIYWKCVDDIIDSYFAFKTMQAQEPNIF